MAKARKIDCVNIAAGASAVITTIDANIGVLLAVGTCILGEENSTQVRLTPAAARILACDLLAAANEHEGISR